MRTAGGAGRRQPGGRAGQRRLPRLRRQVPGPEHDGPLVVDDLAVPAMPPEAPELAGRGRRACWELRDEGRALGVGRDQGPAEVAPREVDALGGFPEVEPIRLALHDLGREGAEAGEELRRHEGVVPCLVRLAARAVAALRRLALRHEADPARGALLRLLEELREAQPLERPPPPADRGEEVGRVEDLRRQPPHDLGEARPVVGQGRRLEGGQQEGEVGEARVRHEGLLRLAEQAPQPQEAVPAVVGQGVGRALGLGLRRLPGSEGDAGADPPVEVEAVPGEEAHARSGALEVRHHLALHKEGEGEDVVGGQAHRRALALAGPAPEGEADLAERERLRGLPHPRVALLDRLQEAVGADISAGAGHLEVQRDEVRLGQAARKVRQELIKGFRGALHEDVCPLRGPKTALI
mmetsp:Transcript_57010/g.167378  ORF Transcript_57010/g.167378 Transcript_57010/m.167378 type:complete len:409 (-) Transcript_57010:44-1270(-)